MKSKEHRQEAFLNAAIELCGADLKTVQLMAGQLVVDGKNPTTIVVPALSVGTKVGNLNVVFANVERPLMLCDDGSTIPLIHPKELLEESNRKAVAMEAQAAAEKETQC